MTDHLPECWAKHQNDPQAWCICDELRACEKRVTAYERSWENAVTIARAGYQDALADVQKLVNAVDPVWCNAHGWHVSRNDVHLMLDQLRNP